MPDLGEHYQAWPMHAIGPAGQHGFQGRCSCRWRGIWRDTEPSADADIDVHLARMLGSAAFHVNRTPPG